MPRPDAAARPAHPRPQWLVITADDFGMAPAVNAAVADAHEHGVLTAASLMVGAPAAAEAVQIARRLPNLRVGLHLVVADGRASLPPHRVPALADAEGQMDSRILARSLRLLRPSVLQQLRAEVRAQFAQYARTGLVLDHVNVHKHLHLHPLILQLVMEEALAHGSPPIRVPYEPGWVTADAAPLTRLGTMFTNGWSRVARSRLRRAGLPCNDAIFGLSHTGVLQEALMQRFLGRLTPGLNEIYLHPAQGAPADPRIPDQRARSAELAVLLSPRVKAAVLASHASLGGYRDATPVERRAGAMTAAASRPPQKG